MKFHRTGALRATSVVLLLAIVAALVCAGVSVRRWMWTESAAVHYWPDMANAWNWGSAAAREGYFPLYDRVVANHPDGNYGLDYVPLRLATMTLWVKSSQDKYPGARGWIGDYDFNAPLLRFNTAMELATALGIFAIAWMWTLRSSPPSRVVSASGDRFDRHLKAAWLALLPLTLAWMNPASIVSAHSRPTWDVWITPFYLWAVFCACFNRWFLAGLLIGIGAMFKGQQLIIAPLFVLWPLMRIRFPILRDKTRKPTILPALSAAGRWILGFAFAISLIASPWLVPQTTGAYILLALGLLLWPTLWLALRFISRTRASFQNSAFRIQNSLRWLIPISLVVVIWLCFAVLGGSIAWAKVGLLYGADKFKSLEVGGASTLASILQRNYGWRAEDSALSLPWLDNPLTVEQLLSTIFVLLLVVSAWAFQSTERRRNRSFLLVVALPWLVYFAVAPRMHERYLLWGALAACLAAAHSPGMTLLAIFFTFCSTTMSLFQILGSGDPRRFLTDISPTFGQSLKTFTHGTYPGLGWAILLATAMWTYVCLFPRRGRDIKLETEL